MRVVSVHADVVVARSEIWQTTCTLLRGGSECFAIDSPVLPDELDALPAILAQAGWQLSGLLCTHADWDHLLGRLAFPETALGCSETSAARLRGAPGEAQRELREFDDEHYLQRPRPLALGQLQALPVPGRLELGDQELELLPADGHTEDGMAVWLPGAATLVCGDYLSPVEIPSLQGRGDRAGYLATLARLAPYVERADWVVPGHGAPLERDGARTILEQDVAYLQALPDPDAPLPSGRSTPAQRRIHVENVERAGGRGQQG
jgi:glyoxylase-like metal-dependent hydrolase (beta-lactamase superfamily II)